ncbi:unnamed protein product [Effrenium voratum]|uniref:Uncharacterized protein n=1 Tax=Effrenium voratum TaxID=2562239 RepID=A0AA36JHV4_9DINO|nr:unnamed protein product [Effrenium voratum]
MASMSSTMGAFAVALALVGAPKVVARSCDESVPCGALDLLFSGPGYSATYRNTWPGWYNAGGYVLDAAGVMLSGNDGKREAYDTVGLVGLRFEDSVYGCGLRADLRGCDLTHEKGAFPS